MIELLTIISLPYMEVQQAIAPLVVAAIIAGAAAIAGAGVNAASQKKANQVQKDIASEQNIYNQTMWERQNSYNSPSAQMARYKAAGLNPNLVYSQQNTAEAIPKAATRNYQAVDYGLDNAAAQAANLYMQYSQLQMAQKDNEASIALKQAQADAVRQETLVKAAREVGLRFQNELNSSTMTYQQGAIKERYNRLLAGNELLAQQQVLNNQKYDLQERRMAIQEQLSQLQWEKLQLEQSRTSLSWSEYSTRKWQIENQERRARKEFNMNYQDWKAMRIGNIGNKYLQWANPLINAFSAWSRYKK